MSRDPHAATSDPTNLANEIVANFANGEFERIVQHLDPRMRKALDPQKLAKGWKDSMSKWGPFVQQKGVEILRKRGRDFVLVRCEGEKSPFTVRLAFDDESRIASLFLQPGPLEGPPTGQELETVKRLRRNMVLTLPVYVLIPVGLGVIGAALWGFHMNWGPFAAGVLGWVAALVLRGPVAVLGHRFARSQETLKRLVIGPLGSSKSLFGWQSWFLWEQPSPSLSR